MARRERKHTGYLIVMHENGECDLYSNGRIFQYGIPDRDAAIQVINRDDPTKSRKITLEEPDGYWELLR